MYNTIFRDGLGRIVGTLDNKEYFTNENDHYYDYKCTYLTFPRHNQGKSSPVTVWNMYDNKN